MDVKRTLLSALPALQGSSSSSSGAGKLPGLDDEDMQDLDVPAAESGGSRSFLTQPPSTGKEADVVPARIKSTAQFMLFRAREKIVESDGVGGGGPNATEVIREGYVGLEGDRDEDGVEGEETGKRTELLGKKLRDLGWERWTDVFVR